MSEKNKAEQGLTKASGLRPTGNDGARAQTPEKYAAAIRAGDSPLAIVKLAMADAAAAARSETLAKIATMAEDGLTSDAPFIYLQDILEVARPTISRPPKATSP